MKIRLTKDCEHGEKGKVIEIDPEKAEAFAAEGKSEPYVPSAAPAPVVAEEPLAAVHARAHTPPAPMAKPAEKAAPKKGKR